MAKSQELVVITKTYDLVLWSCNHTSKFPRNHSFVITSVGGPAQLVQGDLGYTVSSEE
jgi:hypothetical protein